MPIRYSNVVGGGAGNGFNLDIGSSGNTTFELSEVQPAGGYSIRSQLSDATIEFYAIAEDGTLAGYTNSKALTASKDFDTIVVYNATNNDLITFEFKSTTLPTGNGDQDSGAAPFLTSATPTTLASVDDTATITGGNFATDVEIIFTGQDDVDRAAKNVVRSDSTSLIVTRPDDFPVAQEPYSMTATNPGIGTSQYAGTLTDYFDAGGGITWSTTSLLPLYVANTPYSTTLEAVDSDGLPVTYAITAGTLPTGLSLNSSTGEISGTPTVQYENVVITVTATDSGENSSSRDFYVGDSLFIDYLVIAGGGGGGTGGSAGGGGGGGAGGYRSSITGESSGGGVSAETTLAVLPNTNYTITVGAAGAGVSDSNAKGNNGNNSVFASITSTGGGGGGSSGTRPGAPGGSGGGGGAGSTGGDYGGSGNANEGYDGGDSSSSKGGGGGGAGEVGQSSNPGDAGDGGDGVSSSITGTAVYRAGGGGGGASSANAGNGGLGGGGNGKDDNTDGVDGNVNTGSGGGGARNNNSGGNGGSGVVILKYSDGITISSGPGLVYSTDSSSVPGYKITTVTSGSDTITFS